MGSRNGRNGVSHHFHEWRNGVSHHFHEKWGQPPFPREMGSATISTNRRIVGAGLTFRLQNRGIGLAKLVKSMRAPRSINSKNLQIVKCGVY